jgi:DNA-binding Xre family transcriptional regulator
VLEYLPMTARFRLRELLEAAGIGQSQLSRESGVSFSTINRMATNATEQVSLKTLDSISATLTRLLNRTVEPGDLIERVPEKKRGKRG